MTGQELQSLKNKFDIVGNDPALNRALEIAVAVAPTDLTVLITGESGVGKENIPKIVHQFSRRRTGKYFAVNCGAIPEGTIDSELFGHEKGSFTGAVEMRRGYFEEADGGTLFLDEVGEMPLSSQAKLLRVLQSGEFIRVGSSKVLKTDVRVVAATNVNLMYNVARGKFREDLYYRLNAISILMPPLRDRQGDIHLLFRKFASDFSEKYGMGKAMLSEDAVALLKSYRWPGNIRQLKNVAETVCALEAQRISQRQEISAEVLDQYIPKDSPNELPVKSTHSPDDALSSGEREAVFRMLYQLRQEMDWVKEWIAGRQPRPQIPQQAGMPAEEQGRDVFGTAPAAGPFDGIGTNAGADAGIYARAGENAGPDDQRGGAGDYVRRNDTGNGDYVRREAPDGGRGYARRDYGRNDRGEEEPDEQSTEDLSLHRAGEDLIRKALEKYHGNRKAAASELGISERTLYRKLKELDK